MKEQHEKMANIRQEGKARIAKILTDEQLEKFEKRLQHHKHMDRGPGEPR